MKLAMGQCDIPQKQDQPVFELDLYRHNIVVMGASMSGKTTFVKTLLVRLHENMDQRPEESVYIVDFGGNIGTYGDLGNVCACYDSSNEEDIKRLFQTIDERLEENTQLLDSRNYYEVVSKTPKKAPGHLTLIIENINAFVQDERYAQYLDRLARLCRDGLSRGLTVLVTGSDTSGISRLLTYFGQKVAFETPQELCYDLFSAKTLRPMRIPGRGLVNWDGDICEFQCFLPFPGLKDEQYVLALKERTTREPNKHKMKSFGKVLTDLNFKKYCAATVEKSDKAGDIVVGLDYYEHQPVKVNVRDSRAVAIYGKREFGKTNLLHLLLRGIKKEWPDARFVYMDDGRKQLETFCPGGKTPISANKEYITDIGKLKSYLLSNGYDETSGGNKHQNNTPPYRGEDSPVKEARPAGTPFTVFVMQAKNLYRPSMDSVYLMTKLFPRMIGEAEAKGYLFIFSDVPNITDVDVRKSLNNNVSAAFLLDNIGDFLAEKGAGKTAFGEMDAKALKAEYARCSLGDGFFYDIERGELQKLKFIKVE